ncbi:MAG TPA: flavin reductase family protein [candidate division Zixibacteria bacterium]|nr:flavin reductase family protein [candidate division Zixibacteria bacterium]
MEKIKLGPQTLLVPLPVTLLTAQIEGEKPNIITLSWVGICNSEPPMIGVGIRESRFTYHMVVEAGEFVVNIPGENQVKAADLCGNTSGRNKDKFAETGFTAIPADKVSAPLIKECPINMECVVKHSIKLGSHDYFIAEIVETHVNSDCWTDDKKLNIENLKPFAYMTKKRSYYGGFSDIFGDYGYSVKS